VDKKFKYRFSLMVRDVMSPKFLCLCAQAAVSVVLFQVLEVQRPSPRIEPPEKFLRRTG
jgi:hypothetical protein